jgi:hypothetical protein
MLVGVTECRVAQPGDVEVDLVTGDELVVGEGLEPLGLFQLVDVVHGGDAVVTEHVLVKV